MVCRTNDTPIPSIYGIANPVLIVTTHCSLVLNSTSGSSSASLANQATSLEMYIYGTSLFLANFHGCGTLCWPSG